MLIVGLAAAPLLHFLPGKQQRHAARMREAAALGGLFVEFRKLPAGVAGPIGGGSVIYYGKRLPPPRGGEARHGVWRRLETGWEAVKRRAEVPPALLELPAGVLAAAVDDGSCGVFWCEEGEENEVQEIRRALDRWAGDLSGRGG